VAKSNLDHIDPGGYIGVATKSLDDKLVALGVLLFPPAMKGALEGHFDWDPIPDTTRSGSATTAGAMTNGTVTTATPAAGAKTVTSTMTNGTVSSAGASGGAKQVTVTYKGGEADRPRTADSACRYGRTWRQVRCDSGLGRIHQCRPAGRSAKRRGGFCRSQLFVGVNGATPPI